MSATPSLDHIAMALPNLDEHVERLTGAFGMIAEVRFDGFAVLVDPASGLKFELSASADADVHLRHLGFRADEVDDAYAELVDHGMESVEAAQRQDYARMYQARVREPGGLEVQLVKYD